MSEPAASPNNENRILEAVWKIQSDLAVIKAQQDSAFEQLFGNGQPGVVAQLDGRIKTLELGAAEERGEKASSRRWTALLGGLVGAVMSAIYEFVAHRASK